jgi:twitching motility protein PilU
MAPLPRPPLEPGESKEIALSLMTEKERAQFEHTRECNFALNIGHSSRFRVNVYLQRGEVSLVVRLIKGRIPGFAELGLPRAVAQLSLLRSGLVLVVGSTGSGRSTTVSAMIAHRAQMLAGHILTIEDPIEYLFAHGKALVEQREVGLDTASYRDALGNVMRQAPDVVMIDELRDVEIAQHALMYAEAGMLCISTMHANNAGQAISRLIHLFPDETRKQVMQDLALNLRGVVSQRMLPAKAGGLVLAPEILLESAYASSLLQRGATDDLQDAIRKGTEKGMLLFEDSLITLLNEGRITEQTALEVAGSRTELVLKIKHGGPKNF